MVIDHDIDLYILMMISRSDHHYPVFYMFSLLVHDHDHAMA